MHCVYWAKITASSIEVIYLSFGLHGISYVYDVQTHYSQCIFSHMQTSNSNISIVCA